MRTAKAMGKKPRTLYIKNPVAHRLAEQVSKQMGTNLSDAVIAALREKLQRATQPIDRSRVDALCASFDALPVLDSRSADEILGYDAFGIPR